jgi:hypothetical protein
MLSTAGKFASRRLLNNPIFIVGGSRSGTVALLKAMGQHPMILSSPSENPFMTDLGRMAYDLGYATERDTGYYEESLRVSREYIFDSLRHLALESSLGPHNGLKFLLSTWIKKPIDIFGKRYWCTKTFPGEKTAQGLRVLYPNTRFIWILRNGMSVVFSRARFPEFRDLDFREHCQHWANSIQRFAYLSSLPEATVVHQEDLTDNPDAVFRRIFNLVGAPYHSASTEYALHTHVHPLADEGTATGVNVKQVLKERRPPHESWTEEQRIMFKDICGGAMALAGYEIPY